MVQIKKSEADLNKGFLEKTSYAIPKPRKPGDEVKMVTMMLFGNAKECEIAMRLIDEAIENREQKQKQREKEYEKKRDQKNRDRQMYHLRHTLDYEMLEIPIGELLFHTPICQNYYKDLNPCRKKDRASRRIESSFPHTEAYQSLFSFQTYRDEPKWDQHAE